MNIAVTILFCITFFYGIWQVKSISHYGIGMGFNKKMPKVTVGNEEDCKTKWMKQPVDHFNKTSMLTWSMKYFENLKYWKPNGPIYIFIGSNEVYPQFVLTGLMFELAKETNGAMYATEHRYYGESIPHTDLMFLNSRQAVADIARLIKCIKSYTQYNNSKVVTVGGSYGGSLAVWLRQIFPTKVDAVLASSAPILAKADFDQFLVQVAKNFKKIAPSDCWNKIKENFKEIDFKLKYKYGIQKLQEEENICGYVDMSAPENQQLFFQNQLSGLMASSLGGPQEILDVCKMLDAPKDGIVRHMYDEDLNCNNYNFTKIVNILKHNPYMRPSLYQHCHELGHFVTTTSNDHPFPKRVPIEWHYLTCSALFGSTFSELHKGIKYTNFVFGGIKPNVTKVIFVYGEMDPYKHLGVIKTISECNRVLIIPNVSQSRELFSFEDDPPEVINARKEIKVQIKMWFNNTNCESKKKRRIRYS